MLVQPLQSISMAEERQGEARSDDGGLSSLTASLSPSLSIPLNPATIAAMNLAARSGLASYNPLGNLQTTPTLGGLQSSVNLNTLQVLQLRSNMPDCTSASCLSCPVNNGDGHWQISKQGQQANEIHCGTCVRWRSALTHVVFYRWASYGLTLHRAVCTCSSWQAGVEQGLLASGIPPSTLQALLSGLAAGSGDFAAASPTASGLDTRTLAGLLASGAFGAQNIPTTPPKVSAHRIL